MNGPDLISEVGNQDVTELEDDRANERLSAQWETVHEGEVPSVKFYSDWQ